MRLVISWMLCVCVFSSFNFLVQKSIFAIKFEEDEIQECERSVATNCNIVYWKSLALAIYLSQDLHRLRWLLIANWAWLLSVTYSLGAVEAKYLVPTWYKHGVSLLFSAIVAVASHLWLVSGGKQRVSRWGRCRWRCSRSNDTVWIRQRPNVDWRVADAFIAVNWVFVAHCLPQINQFGTNHHRSGFGWCRGIRWACRAASRRGHLCNLVELTVLIFQFQMLQQWTQAVFVERR